MLRHVYNVLSRVYREGAYVGIALNHELASCGAEGPAVTSAVYGVLEHDASLEYYISVLCATRPKPAVRVVLKIGLWQLLYGSAPDYAAVNGTVNLVKEIGKSAQAGFVNAVLKRYGTVPVPSDERTKLMLYTSKPMWYIDRVLADYPDCGRDVLYAAPRTDTHIRGIAEGERTPYGSYINLRALKDRDPSSYTVQSLGSCAVAGALGARDGDRILDACAAPGGKSVFLAESADCRVTSCDLHPHRVELIRAYASRRGVSLDARVQDATAFRPEWEGAFDRVLADVPCSGSGVVWSKPDVLLGTPDLASLNAVQAGILGNVSRYVKSGGILEYATCSLFSAENEAIASAFLSSHRDFTEVRVDFPLRVLRRSVGYQLLPTVSDTEGYYVVKFKRA